MTLNETLKSLGYRAKKCPRSSDGAKYVIKNGTTIFVGNAGDVWKWLRETGQLKGGE